MSTVHPNDRRVLGQLVRLAESVLARPFPPARADVMAALDEVAGDIATARRCPAASSRVGAFEFILLAAVQTIAVGGAVTTEQLYRCQVIACHALPIVQAHYGDAVVADIERAQATGAT